MAAPAEGSTRESVVQFTPLPPDGRRGRVDWEDVAAQLRSRPREWAIVDTAATVGSAGSTSSRIRNGEIAALRPKGHWKSETRGKVVYACYWGPAEGEA